MLTLEILEPVENKLPRDVFVLKVEAGFGDADGIEIFDLNVFPNTLSGKEELEAAIQCCERMAAKYPYGKGGEDGFEDVEGFDKWFCGGDKWPSDPFSDYQFPASFNSYKVVYYDADQIEHPVKINLS